MSEWWTYRPSDFLMFSARTYYRLFELYNADVWPAQLLTLGLGLALWLALWRGRAWAPRAAFALLGVAWLWVAWGFHWQRFAGINWAATWFAGAFAVQGALLLTLAAISSDAWVSVSRGRGRNIGFALLLFAIVAQPAFGAIFGRSWRQAELFGLAPDPTVVGSLGLLLLASPARPRPRIAWLPWPIPVLWCAVGGITLATMNSADGVLMPLAALLAVAAARTRAAK
jgi:hypothetical protein